MVLNCGLVMFILSLQGTSGSRSGVLRPNRAASTPPTLVRRPLNSAMPPAPLPSEDKAVPAPGSVNFLGAVGERPGTFCYIFPIVCMIFLFQV